MYMQGRIMHNALEVDAVDELLKAHRMSPWRAEPLVYLAWQYARRMQVVSRASQIALQLTDRTRSAVAPQNDTRRC